MKAHSISFSNLSFSIEEILRRAWPSMERAGVKFGGSYTLSIQTQDRKDIDIVAVRKCTTSAPLIEEGPQEFNLVDFSFWIDTMEFLLSIDTLYHPVVIRMTFMGNVLSKPGLEKIVEIMLAVVTSLGMECAVLLSEGLEEQETERRSVVGESLLQVLFSRLGNSHEVDPPQLALVRSDLLPDLVKRGARSAGLRVHTFSCGYTMFSPILDEGEDNR